MTKILPDSDTLRLEIINLLKKESLKNKLTDIQTAIDTLLAKYDITGFAVYSEIRDMMEEGILIIDNEELDSNSTIKMNTYKKEVGKANQGEKRSILVNFEALERKISMQKKFSPMISLHCNIDLDTDKDSFWNKDLDLILIGDNSQEMKDWIINEHFKIYYITKMPANFKFILGNYGMKVKALELGSF